MRAIGSKVVYKVYELVEKQSTQNDGEEDIFRKH